MPAKGVPLIPMVQQAINKYNWSFEYCITSELERLTLRYGDTERLIGALQQKNYPAFYAALRKQQTELSFSDKSAQWAIAAAISCTPRALWKVIGCSKIEDGHKQLSQFVLWAIEQNRPEHLKILLDAGASPNQFERVSPMAMAVYYGNMRCLQILLDHPDLSPELPDDVVELWANAENGDTLLDFCISTVAERFYPSRESPLTPLPLPPGLTMAMAAQMHNIPMMKRLAVIYKDLNPSEARHALNILDLEDPAFAEMAGIVFTVCPDVLKDPYVRWKLLVPILKRREIPRDLEPWIEQIKGEELSLYYHGALVYPLSEISGLPKTWDELLDVWQQLFGTSIPLILERQMALPGPLYWDWDLFSTKTEQPLKRAELEALLCHCPVRGDPVPGEASDFAKSLVYLASPRRLLQELQPGGLLEGEDLQKLENYLSLRDHTPQGRAKRAMLLARIQ